jgi:ADP-dependent NAD(P)H-hydrate dehydratase / NAD(P)H-hydrate epimerase
MAEVDRLTSEVYHIPSILLMESAGRSATDVMMREFTDLGRGRVVILCGKGNNGGDGLVIARHLSVRGLAPEVVMLCDPASLRGDALSNWEMVHALGIQTEILNTDGVIRRYLRTSVTPDVVVDAIFGTGLTKPVAGALGSVIDCVNRWGERSKVVAVDIPSGLFAGSHRVEGRAVRAHLTVTFSALKPALVLSPAAELAGRVVLVPIGSPASLLAKAEYRLNLIDSVQVRRSLPARARGGHKGTYGHVFALAGSRGKSGAALMTGMAALRSGAGLVTLLLPESLQRDIVGRFPELMTESLPETRVGSHDESAAAKVLDLLGSADCVVAGPGVTMQPSAKALIRQVVRRSPVPVVLDADGLNAFAGDAGTLGNDAGQPVILTPHPGEMARLIGSSVAAVQADRLAAAGQVAEQAGCYVVLKGHQTIVACPNGDSHVNPTGNPGMGTGGTGDILAGMMGRFIAGWQRMGGARNPIPLADYVCAAVYLHGRAGDIAANEKGEESLVATDLLLALPDATKEVAIDRPRSAGSAMGYLGSMVLKCGHHI